MRKLHRIVWFTVPAVCLLLGWIFYSRWSENRSFIQQLEEPAAVRNRSIVDAHGRDRLTILGFYAAPASVRRGETAQLCYSVSNAKTVRIKPPVKNVWPSFSRCVEGTPQNSTLYELIAEDDKGNKEIAHTNVHVD